MSKSSISENLQGAWTHAHEEDAQGTSVFLASSANFAPSRGRTSFELHADGSARYVSPGASDVPTEKNVLWELVEPSVLVISKDKKILLKADVVHSSEGRMELRIRDR